MGTTITLSLPWEAWGTRGVHTRGHSGWVAILGGARAAAGSNLSSNLSSTHSRSSSSAWGGWGAAWRAVSRAKSRPFGDLLSEVVGITPPDTTGHNSRRRFLVRSTTWILPSIESGFCWRAGVFSMQRLPAVQREEILLSYATEKSMETAEIPLEEVTQIYRRIISSAIQGWAKLRENGICVLVDILQGRASEKRPFGNKGYVSLYTISYRMCSNAGTCDHSKALYDRTKSEIERVLQYHVVPQLKNNDSTDGGLTILKNFSHHWENHKVFVKWMQQLFRHLDNGYVANSSISTITSVGLRLFFDIVFDQFKREISNSLINAIDNERDGANVDPQLLRSCVEVFPVMGLCSKCTDLKTVQSVLDSQPDLSVYEADFETSLLKRTSHYYARKSVDWLESKSTPTYLRKTEAALVAEQERVSRYLHASSQHKLLGACERELLHKHKEMLIEREQSGLKALLSENRSEDLKRMFDLFRRISGGLAPMASTTKKFVQSQGNKILQERYDVVQALKSQGRKITADDPRMIDRLLTLHEKMSRLVFELFDGENQFQRALKEGFQDVINTDATPDISNVEMLVMHTDRVLGGKVRLGEEEVESCLEQIIQLFQFLSDKDLYVELYREQLARRLLSRRSTAVHTEKLMIVKMKTQQGAPFTTKIEGMVNDFTLGALA